jgi:hypothetical protein
MLKVTPARAATGPIASVKATMNMGGNAVDRPRAADDFASIKARMEELRHRCRAADDFTTIRARMEELHRERERAQAPESGLQSEPPLRSARIGYWSEREISAGPGRLRQSGPIRS